MIDAQHVIETILRPAVRAAGGSAAFADLHGISRPYVHDVLNGRRDLGPKVLDAIGMEKIVSYRAKTLL